MYLSDIFERAFPTYIESNIPSRLAALSVLSNLIKMLPQNVKKEKKKKAAKTKATFCFSLGT
jgi:hypothetical protein